MTNEKASETHPPRGEAKARELKEWLDAHPEVWAQVREQIAAGERGEGVPARIVFEEAKRRRTKRST